MMQPGQPSLTALGAARLRAAHQLLDGASILADPLAGRILGDDPEISLRHAEAHPSGPRLRWFIAARSRITEDALTLAAGNGARQLIVLGAGLDTLAYRTPLAGGLRIFEVDHPATQAWKRELLLRASITVPGTLSFVPVNFERETLGDALTRAGFDPAQRSFFSWLGVVPYLTEPAVLSTLAFIAALRGGAEVVFDYVNPPASIVSGGLIAHRALAARVAATGERFQGYFETEQLCSKLATLGFRSIRDMDAREVAARFFPASEHSAPGQGGHIMHAASV
jgi:methyltransferase (TIGR00027 family)